jgi:hypothetical protein
MRDRTAGGTAMLMVMVLLCEGSALMIERHPQSTIQDARQRFEKAERQHQQRNYRMLAAQLAVPSSHRAPPKRGYVQLAQHACNSYR